MEKVSIQILDVFLIESLIFVVEILFVLLILDTNSFYIYI